MGLTELQASLARINDATNNIAADIAGLKALITTSMTPEQVAEVQAALDAAATRLEGIAAETPDAPPAEPV
jgi:hypothetical protein